MPDPRDDALIAELRELGRRVDVPEPADQRAAVRARLATRTPVRAARHRLRRWMAGVAAATLGAVLVVPPARAAVVDAVGGLLRIAGVEVRRDTDPGVLPSRPAPLPSSRGTTLQDARRLARFTVLAPAALGAPHEITVADPDADGAPRVVTVTYRGGAVRLDQFDGQPEPAFMKSAPDAEWTDVGGQTAIWLPRPHPVSYVDRGGVQRTEAARLAGPTLIWSAGSVTYRLEGLATLESALAVANSLR